MAALPWITSGGWPPIGSSEATHSRLLGFVKTALMRQLVPPNSLVCDLFCGRGLDTKRWSEAGIGRYVGVDLSVSALEAAREEWEKSGRPFPAEFCKLDPCMVDLEAHLQGQGLPADVVSCLAHLQDSCISEEMVRRLLKNAQAVLKPGGFFFGTVPDSSTIWYKYQKAVEGAMKAGSLRVNGVLPTVREEIYKITFDDDRFLPFGSTYHLRFTDDGLPAQPQMLVHFPSLIRLAKEVGLECIEIQNLGEFWDDYSGEFADAVQSCCGSLMGNKGDGKDRLSSQALDVLSLYTTFIFRKGDPDMLNNQMSPVLEPLFNSASQNLNSVPSQRLDTVSTTSNEELEQEGLFSSKVKISCPRFRKPAILSNLQHNGDLEISNPGKSASHVAHPAQDSDAGSSKGHRGSYANTGHLHEDDLGLKKREVGQEVFVSQRVDAKSSISDRHIEAQLHGSEKESLRKGKHDNRLVVQKDRDSHVDVLKMDAKSGISISHIGAQLHGFEKENSSKEKQNSSVVQRDGNSNVTVYKKDAKSGIANSHIEAQSHGLTKENLRIERHSKRMVVQTDVVSHVAAEHTGLETEPRNWSGREASSSGAATAFSIDRVSAHFQLSATNSNWTSRGSETLVPPASTAEGSESTRDVENLEEHPHLDSKDSLRATKDSVDQSSSDGERLKPSVPSRSPKHYMRRTSEGFVERSSSKHYTRRTNENFVERIRNENPQDIGRGGHPSKHYFRRSSHESREDGKKEDGKRHKNQQEQPFVEDTSKHHMQRTVEITNQTGEFIKVGDGRPKLSQPMEEFKDHGDFEKRYIKKLI